MKLNSTFRIENYDEACNYCAEKNYTITEIESDGIGRKFKITKPQAPTAKDLTLLEIEELKNWFDGYYSQHEQKYRRLVALNKLADDNNSPSQKLFELFQEAELKRARIQELENQL